jgi:hypothetical protein
MQKNELMTAGIWYGWTTLEHAGIYENMLSNEVFPSIETKKINGYQKISPLKCIMKIVCSSESKTGSVKA